MIERETRDEDEIRCKDRNERYRDRDKDELNINKLEKSYGYWPIWNYVIYYIICYIIQ